MKVIIFDIDGVVVKSHGNKMQIIIDILKKSNLYHKKGVEEILEKGLNRKVLLNEIYKIVKFDKQKVLNEINEKINFLESNPIANDKIVDFIKNNREYILFTNTAMPLEGLQKILKKLNIENSFKELLNGEDGNKLENTQYIIEKYNLKPKDILFIDDNINHINKVKKAGVNLLHYTNYDININNYL